MTSKLKKLLTDRRLLLAMGLLLACAFIWFAGDALAYNGWRPLESPVSRLIAILLVIGTVTAVEGWKRYRSWQANRALLSELSRDDGSNAAMSAREVAELQKRFETALGTLRKARFENKATGGRSYLYQLPWYMFIGAPGSGKTTALVHSGLRFPLAEQLGKNEVQGVGGTRNCDWWFTDQAVLLDTAGRYTTQSSNREVDATAWLAFLRMLRRFRGAQPLNGALITLSVQDLLTQNESERADYARSVRRRIQELYGELGVRFPLYLMVTKTDLLAGFSDIFSDMGREQREQVWGLTFEYRAQGGSADIGKNFRGEFEALCERLFENLFARIENERDAERRARIYNFPQQFANLGPLIEDFLDEVFGDSAFEERGLLRGVYFTSGTQEGTPFDRVLGSLSRTLNLDRKTIPPLMSSGKSYFVTRLLQDVVFVESDLTGRNEQVEQRQRKRWLLAYGLLGLLSVLLIAGWLVSYFRNQSLVDDTQSRVVALDQRIKSLPAIDKGNLIDILPVLDAVRDLPGGYGAQDTDVPLSLGLGLYQGDKLGQQSETAYLALLREAFLPRLALRLEEQIRSTTDAQIRYEALKTYLMLAGRGPLDAEALKAWVGADWKRTLPKSISEQDRSSLAQHLDAALADENLDLILPLDESLITQTRLAIGSAPLANRVYARLIRLSESKHARYDLGAAAGPSAPLVFRRDSGNSLAEGPAALFTVSGYQQDFLKSAPGVIDQLSKEQEWVLGKAAGAITAPASTLSEVRRLYFNDYIKQWSTVLDDLRLTDSGSLDNTIQALSVLTGNDSPLKRMVAAVARETRLDGEQPAAAADGAGDAIKSAVRQTVDRLLGSPEDAATTGESGPSAVSQHFQPLHDLVSAPSGSPAPLDSIIALLKDYQVHLVATQEASRRQMPPPTGDMLEARIRSEAIRYPQPVRNVLLGLLGSASGQAAATTQAGLQKAMAGGVSSYCKQATANRYPFVRSSKNDVPLGDFSKLFAPGGELDRFFQTNLQPYVDTTARVWKPRPIAEGVGSVAPGVVTQFQNAATIREAFFPNAQINPSASAELTLIDADPSLGEIQLSADGQVFVFAPGRQATARLLWPSLNANSVITLGSKSVPDTLTGSGPWSVFRLLDHGRNKGGGPDRYQVEFDLSGRIALFELRVPSIRNPFRLPELSQFRCPG